MMLRELYSARGFQPIQVDLRGFVDPVQDTMRVDNSTRSWNPERLVRGYFDRRFSRIRPLPTLGSPGI